MNRNEAWKLSVGDHVVIWRRTQYEAHGTVTKRAAINRGIEFAWDDGSHGVIHPDDMQDVERSIPRYPAASS